MKTFFTLPRVSAHNSFQCSDKTCAVSVLNSFEKIPGVFHFNRIVLTEKCHIKAPKSQGLVRYSYAAMHCATEAHTVSVCFYLLCK